MNLGNRPLRLALFATAVVALGGGAYSAKSAVATKADAIRAASVAQVRARSATQVLSYAEHSLGKGSEAQAVSYIQIKTERGQALFGAGIDTNIELASIKAIVSALNRALAKR